MSRQRPEIVVAGVDLLSEKVAEDLTAEFERTLGAQQYFSIALPGGSVAEHFFPRLSRLSLDWTRVRFFWVDERAVPPTDSASNYARAKSLWLEPAGVPIECIHRMPVDVVDRREAVSAYASTLRRVLGSPPRLDFVLLGVGEDGHVASLFPRHAALLDQQLVSFVDDAPFPPRRRMTLTMPVLTSAGRIVVGAFGAAKAATVRDALLDEQTSIPLGQVVRGGSRVLLLLDPEAAQEIEL